MLYIAFVFIFLSNFLFTYNKNHLSKKNSSGVPIFHRSWAISTGLTPLEILITTNNTFDGYTGENCIFGGNM